MRRFYQPLLTLLLICASLATYATHFNVSTLNGSAPGSLTWALTQVNSDNSATLSNPHVVDICVGGNTYLSPLPQHSCVINCPKDMSLTVNGIYYNIGVNLSGIRVTINNAVFTGNSGSAFGSAFMGSSGACYLFNNCLFSNNNAQYQAGGVFMNGDSAFLYGCTFYNNVTTNSGGAGGGAVYNNGGYISIINCTFDDNASVALPSYAGGGAVLNNGNMDVINCTFVNNHSAHTGGGLCNRGGTFCNITNCIFVGNTADTTGNNVWGYFGSNGGSNLFGDTVAAVVGGVTAGNIYTAVTTLVLDTVLRNNGHYMLTNALVAGSAAINAGTTTGAPVTDAREYGRNSATDIGAFEYQGSNPCAGFATHINPVSAGCSPSNNTFSSTTSGGGNIVDANWFDGTNYTCGDTLIYFGAGTFTFTVTDTNHCVAKDTITVSYHAATASITGAICGGGSYTLGTHVYSTAGTYVDTLFGAAANGCDSVVTLTLVVNPAATALHFKGWNDFNGPVGNNVDSALYNFVTVPDAPSLELGNTYTIEAWVNLDDSSNNAIIDKGNYGYLFETHPNGQTGLGINNSSMGWKYSAGVVPTHTWVHVAVTFDAVNDQVVFYMNGNVLSTSNGISAPAPDNGIVTIGMQSPANCSCNNFDGKMDELRIWNRVLCQTEIQGTMNCELDTTGQTGLVALYHFNQGCVNSNNAGVTTLIDASANHNNGALQNFALTGDTSNWSSGIASGTCAAPVASSVSVRANQVSLCAASSDFFTATATNPGIAGFQWYKNGTAVGTNSSVYNVDSLNNNDTVWVVLSNSVNCDTVVSNREIMHVYPNYTTRVSQSICPGTSYRIGAHTFTSAGIDTVLLPTVNACDSFVILNLSVFAPAINNITASVCPGQSYTVNGHSYSTAGNYSDTLTGASAHGCDSIVNLSLSVYSASTHTITTAICPGESYTVGSYNYNTTGTFTDTLTGASQHGCDSVVTLHLTVYAKAADTISASICSPQAYSFGGHSYTTGGTYSETLSGASVHGCDSIVVLLLSVYTAPVSNITTSVCHGHVYIVGTDTFAVAGDYTDTLVGASVHGCDSIVNLHLSIAGPVTANVAGFICQGGSYTIGNHQFTQSGTDTLFGASMYGCDSIVTLSLTIYAASSTDINATICTGQSYTVNGHNYNATGNFTDTLTGATNHGCDSIVVLHLTVTPAINDTAVVSGATCIAAQSDAVYQWINCSTHEVINGANSQTYTATSNGDYQCALVVGYCADTTNCVTVTGVGIDEAKGYSFSLYPNPTSGSFIIEHNYQGNLKVRIVTVIGSVAREFDLAANKGQFDISELPAGLYEVMIVSDRQTLDVFKVAKE